MSTHTVELKRDDGNRVMIIIELKTGHYLKDGFEYQIKVLLRGKRQKIWRNTFSPDDFLWRRSENKNEYVRNLHLKHVTEEEIFNAKLQLWEKIKPKL